MLNDSLSESKQSSKRSSTEVSRCGSSNILEAKGIENAGLHCNPFRGSQYKRANEAAQLNCLRFPSRASRKACALACARSSTRYNFSPWSCGGRSTFFGFSSRTTYPSRTSSLSDPETSTERCRHRRIAPRHGIAG